MALLLSLALAATPEAPAPAPSTAARILVMDVGGGAVGDDEAGLLGDAIAREVSRHLHGEVLSSGDVRRLFDTMGTRQEMDCDTDACLAELGSALGASRVVHGTVVRLGSRLVLQLALIEPDRARTLGRASAQADSIEALYDAIPAAVAELVSGQRPADGLPVLTAVGGTIAGVGVVGTVGAGVALGILFGAARDPDGDPVLKEAFLEHGTTLGIAAAVAAGVTLVGGGVLVAGLVGDGP